MVVKKPYCTLHEDTLYRISPLANGNQAGYRSNDWMLKVSGTNRNALCLLKPLSTGKMVYPPGTILKSLNLLDYRISEICKSYRLDSHDNADSDTVRTICMLQKIVLRDYVVDCDLTVLALFNDGCMLYWKSRDEIWSPIDTKGHIINEVILYDGKCYAIDRAGALVSFDSKLQLTVIASSLGHYSEGLKYLLLECKSELYLVSWAAFSLGGVLDTQYKATFDLKLSLRKFSNCNGGWDCIENLGDNVFLLGDDISVGVSAKDFEMFRGNSVYLAGWWFTDDSASEVYGERAGIYRLDDPKPSTIGLLRYPMELNRHFPSWLMSSSSSPEP